MHVTLLDHENKQDERYLVLVNKKEQGTQYRMQTTDHS
jgi:hypothetical protein